MRICYIADGGDIHARKWIRYFADKGHDVHLISSNALEVSDMSKVKFHRLSSFRGSTLLRVVSHIFQVRSVVRQIKPEVLHAHYAVGPGLLGALSGFHPFALSAWGSDILVAPKQSKIYEWAVRYAISRADVVHCDADHIMGPLVELGAKREKIKIVHFGVDTQKFAPIPNSNEVRNELGLSDSPTVISLRYLEPIYNVETLIDSIPLVLKKIGNAKFVIAGSGSQEAQLKQQADALGVSTTVKFTGQIPNDLLPKYLNSADVYVSTSLSDAGLAASTAEAMSCGLAVIITDFGDNRKWVVDGVNGFLFPLKNPTVLASRITCLLRNKEVRDKFGQMNRQIIEERNDWYKEMGKIEKLYGALIRRSAI
jgi:glycosyltransferase involved in cell wall biosynthesis